jgi:hypothetical protein
MIRRGRRRRRIEFGSGQKREHLVARSEVIDVRWDPRLDIGRSVAEREHEASARTQHALLSPAPRAPPNDTLASSGMSRADRSTSLIPTRLRARAS